MLKAVLTYFKGKLCLRPRPSLRKDINGNWTNKAVQVPLESDQDKKERCHDKTIMEINQFLANKEGDVGRHYGNKRRQKQKETLDDIMETNQQH